jgi:hypothetical protein
MAVCRVWAAVNHGDLDQDVLLVRLGIFNKHIEVAVLLENPGIQKFIFEVEKAAPGVLIYQIPIRKLGLGVFVEHFHIAVGRGAVEVEVIFLDILPVVSLGTGKPE